MKRDLIFLSHRIPYPPDKGDKIRSWHLLRHLAEKWQVHLGAFVDDPDDWRHVDVLRSVCADVKLLPLDPTRRKFRSLTGLVSGEALTLPYYRNRALSEWTQSKLDAGIKTVMVYSSAMAQYVMAANQCRRVMDFVDIDSDKWRQYAPTKSWPLSWLYRREGERLFDWERKVANAFDVGLFVSEAESSDFQAQAPETSNRISYFNNGVDSEYFTPELTYQNPYPTSKQALVFTGAMDYWPNIDAVTWFVKEVLPNLVRKYPRLVFFVVGSRPTPEVRALANDNVVVTGRVEDVRPYLAHAVAVVAPLRIARGVQNKVLEAMAMAKTVISSPQALEGITARLDEEILCADGGENFVAAVERVLEGGLCGDKARCRVVADYSWSANLARVDTWLTGGTAI